jgi:hypothetical protein
VGRAKKATLQRLDSWLDSIRELGIDGLVEKANGAFYQRRNGILHFHEDAEGHVAADVKISGEWQRVAIDGAAGRRRVVTMLRKEYVPGRAGRSPSPG